MMQADFIRKALHKPWVNRASSWDSMDCWGLVIMYYRHVLNIELPSVDGYSDGVDISTCWLDEVAKGHWETTDYPTQSGLVFTCYMGDKPTHVGVYIGNGKVLHSRGSPESPGRVEIHSARAVESIYGKITYHRFLEN